MASAVESGGTKVPSTRDEGPTYAGPARGDGIVETCDVARRTASMRPEAHASLTVTNSLRRSRSLISNGTFAACPSGQLG